MVLDKVENSSEEREKITQLEAENAQLKSKIEGLKAQVAELKTKVPVEKRPIPEEKQALYAKAKKLGSDEKITFSEKSVLEKWVKAYVEDVEGAEEILVSHIERVLQLKLDREGAKVKLEDVPGVKVHESVQASVSGGPAVQPKEGE